MNLPQIDVSSLPDLSTLTGAFGSLAHSAQAQVSDDSIIALMVFIYNLLKPV